MSKMSDWLASLSEEDCDYALKYLPSHMAEASDGKKLFRFLTDFDFIAAKISHPELQSQDLIEDYDRAFEPKVSISGEQESTLKLIQGALRLSAHILARDKTQLLGQLCGRLMCFNTAEIQAMLSRGIHLYASKPWLRPLTASLTPPGGRLLRTLTGHTHSVNAVAITPDGKQAISGSWDNSLKLWDLTTGTEVFSLTGHTRSVNAVAITPDGKQAISGSYDKSLKLWDLTTGTEVFSLTGHSSLVKAVAITPDGKQAISASSDKSLKLWDLTTGTEVFSLTGRSSVNAVAITSDGKQAISGSLDESLKLWDLTTGTEVFSLTGHSSSVNAVAITPDGKQAISASSDNSLKLWDLQSREVIASFIGDSALHCCAVAPDGVTIVAGEASGRVHFLRLEGVARRG